MSSSLMNYMLGSLSDTLQNPIALIIFGIISILVVLLILASFSPGWRTTLIKYHILEKEEKPVSLLIWIVGIVVTVKLLQTFIIQPFIVDGGSMLPTFHNREFLLVDKLSYRVQNPHRGDVAIFKLYEGSQNPYSGKHLIKRIIGLPGERVVVRDGRTFIYNATNLDGFELDESYVTYKDLSKNIDLTLGADEYFMMGDNRAQSYDSRSWGALKEKDLKGQVLFRIYPFANAAHEPGRFLYTK